VPVQSYVPIRLLELQSQPGSRLGNRGDRRQEGYSRSPAVYSVGGIVSTQGRAHPRQLVGLHLRTVLLH
jgi:hypothetical protein